MQAIIANGKKLTPRGSRANSARPTTPGKNYSIHDGEVFNQEQSAPVYHDQDFPPTSAEEEAAWRSEQQWNRSHVDSEPFWDEPVPTQARSTQTRTSTPAKATQAQASTPAKATQPTPVHHDDLEPGAQVYAGYGTAPIPIRTGSWSTGLVMIDGQPTPRRLVRSGDGVIHIRPLSGQITASGVIPLSGTTRNARRQQSTPRSQTRSRQQTRASSTQRRSNYR